MSFKEYKVKVYKSGTKEWFLDGKLHREDGPAIEWSNGNKFWFLDGKLHRKDGPAIELNDGHKEWFLDDKKLTEQEFNNGMKKNSCGDKIVEIDGVKYQLKVL